MNSRLRIAVTQPAASGDIGRNAGVAADFMREAASRAARLIHFPEGFLTGYAKEQLTDWTQVDWPAARHQLGELAALAGKLGIWVVLGSAHQLSGPHRPHNSVYVISDHGQIIDRYDKRFCSHTEINHFYTPGTHTVVFDVDGFRFGTLVCIEINFPELFCEYEQLGVDCLLLYAYPIDAIFHVKARALAAINNYWLALSTPAQTRQLVPSGLIGPHGQVLANAGNDQMLVVADLDRTAPDLHIAINLARPWRAAARQGDIYRTRHVSHPRSTNRTNA